jgi:hypothetical protein
MSRNLEHDLQIQRLVDGELSRSEIQQLLQTANSQPDVWRELAVAFVEDRIFASESRRFSQSEGRVLEPAASPAAIPPAAGGMPGSANQRPSAWRNTGLWLAAAAMMICAAGLGFLVGRDQGSNVQATGPNLIANSPQPRPEAAENLAAPYTFQLVDNQGRPIPDAAVPLMTEEVAKRLGYNPAQATIPAALQSQFRRAGLELEPEIKYIKNQIDDGRRFSLPYIDLKVRSYGQ